MPHYVVMRTIHYVEEYLVKAGSKEEVRTLVNLQQVEPVGTVSFDEDGSMSIIEREEEEG